MRRFALVSVSERRLSLAFFNMAVDGLQARTCRQWMAEQGFALQNVTVWTAKDVVEDARRFPGELAQRFRCCESAVYSYVEFMHACPQGVDPEEAARMGMCFVRSLPGVGACGYYPTTARPAGSGAPIAMGGVEIGVRNALREMR